MKSKTLTASLLLSLAAGLAMAGWTRLADDGLHDPDNPAIDILQQPATALAVLPPDTAGNRVDWVKALQDGHIDPRSSLSGEGGDEILDLDILMRNTHPVRYVNFSHRVHTQWMDCEICHDHLFVAEIGTNPVNMGKILAGEYCGVCHGAVAFPLTECDRCHNTDSSTVSKAQGLGR